MCYCHDSLYVIICTRHSVLTELNYLLWLTIDSHAIYSNKNSDGDNSKRFEAIPSTDCVNEFADDFGNRMKYLVYTILFVLTAILGFSIGTWFVTIIASLLALKSFWAFLSGDASGSGL